MSGSPCMSKVCKKRKMYENIILKVGYQKKYIVSIVKVKYSNVGILFIIEHFYTLILEAA